MKYDGIPEEIGRSAESGEMFGKLAQLVEEKGYEIVGPSVTVCYNDPRSTPEEE